MSSSKRRRTSGARLPTWLVAPWLGLAVAAALGARADDPVKIGILAGSGARDLRLIAGAERAVARWNAGGGLAGRPVRLAVVEPARPWQDGAGRIARLVFEENVVGLIGPLDAPGAHVAAQIATTNRIPVVVLSPEDSLTRAFDPWIFRGVPGDREQARVVLRGAFGEPRGKRVALAVPAGREARERLPALLEVCDELGVTVAAIWRIDDDARTGSLEPAVSGLDAVLVWLDPEPASRWLDLLGRRGRGLLLGSTRLGDGVAFAGTGGSSARLVLPRLGDDGAGLYESLGHDLVDALLHAAAGTDGTSAAIRGALATGPIGFDARGNRAGEAGTVVLLSGSVEAADGRPAS